MLAQLGKTAALIALIAAPTLAIAGGYGEDGYAYDRYGGGDQSSGYQSSGYQASGYGSESYSASTRVEEEAHGVTGVVAPDGRAYVTGSYQGGYASGGGYETASQDGYAQSHDARQYGEGYDEPDSRAYAPPPGYGSPCPQAGGERVLRCVYVPRQIEVHLNDSFFAGGGGVGPDYISGGGGGGGFVMAGGMASAGARAGAYASASASASARVSVSGGRHGGKGGCGCH